LICSSHRIRERIHTMYKLWFVNFSYMHEKEHSTLEEAIAAAIKHCYDVLIYRSGERVVGPSQSDEIVGSWSFFGGYKSLENVK
jgi:hypothetical protein